MPNAIDPTDAQVNIAKFIKLSIAPPRLVLWVRHRHAKFLRAASRTNLLQIDAIVAENAAALTLDSVA